MRNVLTRLDTKQQALIFGHAVPMPVVVHTRDYGTPESYAQLTSRARPGQPAEVIPGETEEERLEREIEEIFGN